MEKEKSKLRTFAAVSLFVSMAAVTTFLTVQQSGAQQLKYTGREDHAITVDQAVKFIGNFRNKPVAPNTKGAYFGRNIFDKILSQNGCVGIRYYYAATDSGVPTIVLVGVDSTGNDQMNGILGEMTYPCPPWCAPTNALNK